MIPGALSEVGPAPTKPQPAPLGGVPNRGYNGIVQVDGQPVEVVDGKVDFNGQTFFVSDDGSVVIDDKQQIVGRIQDGVFFPTDDAHIEELKKKGWV